MLCEASISKPTKYLFTVKAIGRSIGGSEGSLEPPPPVFLKISHENEIIWSQLDQIISFSWDI